MIRILHVITGMGSGGAESMIMNWYRKIDRTKIQFDFLLRSNENIYRDEIEEMGGRVYYMPEFPKRYFSNFLQTYNFFKKHHKEYNIIHVHANALIYTNVFLIAKHFGIKHRIIHSHSTSTKSKLFLPLHKINKLRIKRMANCFLACSKEAGEWCFKDSFTVINNGIDTEKFKYSKSDREDIREEFGIENNATVFCHVGRFLEVKNHSFLLELFEKIYEEDNESFLILVGTGPLKTKYENAVKEMNCCNNVIFAGVRSDVHKIMSASDVLIFPSLYEGVAVTLIEAQANGLYSVVSDVLPSVVKITDNIVFLSLKDELETWKNVVKNQIDVDRLQCNEMVKNSDFNIENVAEYIQSIYINLDKESSNAKDFNYNGRL